MKKNDLGLISTGILIGFGISKIVYPFVKSVSETFASLTDAKFAPYITKNFAQADVYTADAMRMCAAVEEHGENKRNEKVGF